MRVVVTLAGPHGHIYLLDSYYYIHKACFADGIYVTLGIPVIVVLFVGDKVTNHYKQ